MRARRIYLALGVLAACAHPSIGTRGGGLPGEAPGRPAPSDACVLKSGDVVQRPAKITIGLAEPVDPRHAPVPQNDAERIVFRHLYETPARVDCQGRVLPELAEKWVRDDDGRRWTFRLRDDAQFWDGAPVMAQDIVFGRSGAGYTLGALEARVVTVSLARPSNDVPVLLADPGLAVSKRAPDGGWPIGTGPYWTTSSMVTPQEIRAQGTRGDTLVFRLTTGDARDQLDAGVDLLVTRDPTLRDYAATLPTFMVSPLPWDRTYVLVTPEPGGTRWDGLEQSVHADARRPESGFWWLNVRPCGTMSTTSPPVTPGAQRRVLYRRADPTARELASRLAALTRGVAVARTDEDFAAGLASGRDWGYIVALPRIALDPCRAARDLLPGWAATITALVDTRATAIVRRGVARWAVDQDGTVYLLP